MGEYQWRSYEQVEQEARTFAAGLRSLGCRAGKAVAMFAETRAEWMVAAHGCFKQTIPLVTIYATLGDEAIAHGINETEVSTVITTHDLLPKFRKILAKTPKATSEPAPPQTVSLLAAAPGEPYVFVYCDPGVCVYQYSVATKQQTARLDCGKLVPCSESLETIAIESISTGNMRVTSLCSFNGCLYVGTLRGCVVVCDAATLRPLTVFRPQEDNVASIVPLPAHSPAGSPMLATLGTGYRPLVNRYAPQQSSNSTQSFSGPYCLLWRALHWLPD